MSPMCLVRHVMFILRCSCMHHQTINAFCAVILESELVLRGYDVLSEAGPRVFVPEATGSW